MIFVEINDFKHVNGTLGHAAGRRAADRHRETPHRLRPARRRPRPHTASPSPSRALLRLRPQHLRPPCTGVATSIVADANTEEPIGNADAAMYQAKQMASTATSCSSPALRSRPGRRPLGLARLTWAADGRSHRDTISRAGG